MFGALGDPYSSYLTPRANTSRRLQGISGQFEGIGAKIGTVRRRRDVRELHHARHGLPAGHRRARSPDRRPRRPASSRATSSPRSTGDRRRPDGRPGARDIVRGPEGHDGHAHGRPRQRGAVRPPDHARRHRPERGRHQGRSPAGPSGYIASHRLLRRAPPPTRRGRRRADVAAGQKKLILDLRGNPGGFVTAARTIASQFIASAARSSGSRMPRATRSPTNAEPGGAATDPSIKLVVLIDGGSASAQRDRGRRPPGHAAGQLVGQQTFGKGTVQQWQRSRTTPAASGSRSRGG